MKQCSICLVGKNPSEYYKDKRTCDGLYSCCKKCHKVEYTIPYFEKHPGVKRKYAKEWMKKNRRNNQIFKVNTDLSAAISNTLSGSRIKKWWEPVVGYSRKKLLSHLEQQFNENMSWGNYGKYWSLDHIKPKKAFNIKEVGDKEFEMCWNIENLRPLEIEKNANRKYGERV
jgi:hypothetical protein